jgi:hypothetical protein
MILTSRMEEAGERMSKDLRIARRTMDLEGRVDCEGMVNIDLAQKYLDQEITREGAIYLAMARAAPVTVEVTAPVDVILTLLGSGQDVILPSIVGRAFVEHGSWVIEGSRWDLEYMDVGDGQSCVLSAVKLEAV